MFSQLRLDALKKYDRTKRYASLVAGGLCALASVLTLHFWLDYNPARALAIEEPGHDGAPTDPLARLAKVELSGVFAQFDGMPSKLTGEWTSFRGANSDNVAQDAPKLSDSWGTSGPKVVWSIPVGDGYAAPAVLNGRVYLMDYDVENRADAIRCLSLDDGKDIWRRAYGLTIKRNHGMSRTIPAVNERYLVTVGPKCHVVCLDSESGDFRWGLDLQRDYGTVEPLWYAGQCPLLEGDTAIIAPCGKDVLMMAVDCATGKVTWQAPNPRGWNMSHSSVMPMTLLGKKMYVYSALGGLAAVAADGPSVGEILFELPWDAKVVAPSPVQAGDDLIFCTAGYGKGSRLLKLYAEGEGIRVETVYDLPPGEILSCEQQTPIFNEGLLYGIMPKDAGALKGQFVCYRPDGELVWSSGQDIRFGIGPFLLADGKFFILDDKGLLTMADAREKGFKKLGEAQVLHGHDAWGPLALAGSRLLLRDLNTLACVELGEST